MKKAFNVVPLLVIVTAVLGACSVLQAPEEASGPIEAVPLEIEESEVETAVEPAGEAEEMEEVAEEAAEEVVEAPAAEEVAEEMAAEEPVAEEPAATSAGGLTVFSINQDASNVRFELDEDLRGNRITVVGETNQVAGEIAVDFADLSTTQVGVIQINARTLATDNNFRNRALNNEILDTGDFEFITFTPTAVNDLPDAVAIGDSVQFTVVGDLTIRDITNEVTFAIEATAVSATELSGTASAVVMREAYGLQIPSVPNVANVEEEVELYIDFVANASP